MMHNYLNIALTTIRYDIHWLRHERIVVAAVTDEIKRLADGENLQTQRVQCYCAAKHTASNRQYQHTHFLCQCLADETR